MAKKKGLKDGKALEKVKSPKYELKTKMNEGNVNDFIERVENQKRRVDSFELLKIMKEISGQEPKMWGDSIIGFGFYQYKQKSGREIDWFHIGFSPRKQSLSIYIMDGFDTYDELLNRLGKHKIGKACLYINKLEDVNISVLKELILESLNHIRKITNKNN